MGVCVLAPDPPHALPKPFPSDGHLLTRSQPRTAPASGAAVSQGHGSAQGAALQPVGTGRPSAGMPGKGPGPEAALMGSRFALEWVAQFKLQIATCKGTIQAANLLDVLAFGHVAFAGF